MKLVQDLQQWQQIRGEIAGEVGFVPTMGALHRGHLSLVEQSLRQNAATVVSIFVNPTQFDDPRDLAAYPQTLASDLELLQQVDWVLAPSAQSMYPQGYRYRLKEQELSQRFCGAHRPGHFDGMLTVVLKLFNLVRPRRAYFGEKDFQQLQLVRDMVADLFLPLEIIACATVREPDGLALSSRNQRLSPEERQLAPRLHQLLNSAMNEAEICQELQRAGFRVDYLERWQGRRLAAAHLGSVRLIDNVPVTAR